MLAARQGNSRNPIWIPDDEEEEEDEFEGDEEYDAGDQDADYVEWAQYGAPIWLCCILWVRTCFANTCRRICASTTSVLTTSEAVLALRRWAPDGSRRAVLMVHIVLLASSRWLSAWWFAGLTTDVNTSSQ